MSAARSTKCPNNRLLAVKLLLHELSGNSTFTAPVNSLRLLDRCGRISMLTVSLRLNENGNVATFSFDLFVKLLLFAVNC